LHMKRTILALLATAAFAAAGTIASAQQDPINSAPKYSPSATGATPDTPAKIIDGNNSAPNYNPMAPAGSGGAAKIIDSNNSAPNYGTATAAAPTAAKRQTAAAKSTSGQHASHHHHKHHTPAS